MRRLLLLPVAASCLQAHAGRPMVSDDASILDPDTCQLESWTLRSRDSDEVWAVPACGVGSFELAVGAGRAGGPGGRHNYGVLQAKTNFKPLDVDGWGVGLAFGTQTSRGLAGDRYAYVPVSWSLLGDRLQLHVNLGWLHERQTHRNHMTWALGSEVQVGAQTWLSAETFGRNTGRPSFQLGARRWLLADRVQIDASLSDRLRHNHGERAISIGLKFVTPP